MMPEWLDFDRLQALLALAAVLAVLIALIVLALARRPVLRVLGVAIFAVIAGAAIWQTVSMEEERRTDCGNVEVFGSRVTVPNCPDPSA